MQPLIALVGTRPEAIKMAPVIQMLRQNGRHPVKVVSTGQHREMLRQTLGIFGLVPDVELDVMQPNQSLSTLTANLLRTLDPLIDTTTPAMMIAQGDTTSVMVAALVSFYRRLPFAHVEAGLRTGDINSPFPEEFNRMVAGLIASLHFAPTQRAADNLRAEKVSEKNIYLTGNTVIDALLWAAERAGPPPIQIADGRRLILVTCHRRENFGAPLGRIFNALKRIIAAAPDCEILYPVHPNPNVRDHAHAELKGLQRVHLVDPLDYNHLVAAMKHATLVLTDSGGIQEEAPSLKKPVLVLRESTERPEAIESGVAAIAGTDEDAIFSKAMRLLTDKAHYASMATGANPYGDGHAAKRIVGAIETYLSAR
jgi:UDP-N-acetylglucosamine 2-epimerase (non-hydrolysing)